MTVPLSLADDDFTIFGLPRRQALDRAMLDARWRELQTEVHPDRFAAEDAAAQRLAMQWAVRVNEAYRRLKDPLTRAAYLCALRGAAIDAECNTAMPAAFLAQQMQWRESLDDAATLTELQQLEAAVHAAEAELLHDLQRRLDEHDDAVGAAAKVRALMFVQRFQRDIERRLQALEDARESER